VLFGIAGSHQPAGKALANQILIHDYEWPSYHVVEEFADLVENPGDLLSIYIYICLQTNMNHLFVMCLAETLVCFVVF
jgi:hypothetical protein